MHSEFSRSKKTLANRFDRGVEGVTCRTSTKLDDLFYFYDLMFRPLMIRKFGEAARIESLEEMKAAFLNGFLLLLEKNSEVVAGALLVPEGKKLVYRRIGVLHGDESLVSEGLQSLIYYYQLRYANEHGFESLDALISAPFVSDGVYKHKAQWGALPYASGGEVRIGYLSLGTPSVRQADFFRLLPLIIRHSDKFAVLVGLADGAEASEAWVKSVVQGHPVRGIKHLIPLHPVSGLSQSITLTG
jgi:hypothetical protein